MRTLRIGKNARQGRWALNILRRPRYYTLFHNRTIYHVEQDDVLVLFEFFIF